MVSCRKNNVSVRREREKIVLSVTTSTKHVTLDHIVSCFMDTKKAEQIYLAEFQEHFHATSALVGSSRPKLLM